MPVAPGPSEVGDCYLSSTMWIGQRYDMAGSVNPTLRQLPYASSACLTCPHRLVSRAIWMVADHTEHENVCHNADPEDGIKRPSQSGVEFE